MKKFAVLIAFVSVLAFAGCLSTGGGKAEPANLEPFVVDLSTLPMVRNAAPFTQNYGDFMILLPEFPVDLTKYTRVTIRAKCFDRNGREMEFSYSNNAMVSLIIDPTRPDAELRREGPNVPLKEFNVTPDASMREGTDVSTSRCVRTRLSKNPGAILLQNAGVDVGYIELVLLAFHNGDFEPELQAGFEL